MSIMAAAGFHRLCRLFVLCLISEQKDEMIEMQIFFYLLFLKDINERLSKVA